MAMESCEEMICQTCGSTGFSNAILMCTICKTAVEHQYCLEKRPAANEVMLWICRNCKPKPLYTQAEAKVHSTMESLDLIRSQSHPPGNKLSCYSVNDYHELSGFSPIRIENYLPSTRKQFETVLSMPEGSKSSYVSSLTKEAATTSASSFCTPSGGMPMLQSESDIEMSFPVEIGGTSTGSCGKLSDHWRPVRPRRRMLLPEEDQLDQVHGINIIGEKSRRKSSSADLLFQGTDSSSTTGQDKQVHAEKKRNFVWSDDESEPMVITGQNSQKGNLYKNDKFLLQIVDHASTVGENDPSEVTDRLQTVSARYRAEKFSLRQKRKLTQSYKDRSVEAHDNIIAQGASKERLLADKGMAIVIHDASMVEIDAPPVACNRFQMAHPEYNPEQAGTQAQPIMDQMWRGCFDVCDQEYGPLVAHLSSKACEKVRNAARALPPILQMAKLSRCEGWPKCFETSPPSEDSIALYFFAQDDRIEVSELLDDVIKKDLMLKIVLDEAELLVFSSIILPENSQIFQGKYYLWGAFKGRKTGLSNVLVNSSPTSDNPWLKPLKAIRKSEIPEKQQGKSIAIRSSQSVSFESHGHLSGSLSLKPFEKVVGQEVPSSSINATLNSGKPLALCQGTLHEQTGVVTVAFSKAKCRKMRAIAKKRTEYEVGDLVFVKLPFRQDNCGNLHRQQNCYYEGPFRVVKKVGKVNYKLKIPYTLHQHSIFPARLLKLHHRNKELLGGHNKNVMRLG